MTGSSKKEESTPAKNGGTDYTGYELNAAERAAGAALLAAACAAAGILFYRSLLPAVLGLALIPFVWRLEAGFLNERRKREFIRQFCDGMSGYASAIRAGYSPEKGIDEAIRSLEQIYGSGSMLAGELAQLRRRMSVGETIEHGLSDLAVRSGIREIDDMAGVFSAAKRSGGSLPAILKNSVYIMEEKNRIREEIHTMMTAKRLEERIMCLMPAGILLYVNLTGGDFVEPLYEGASGRIIMTVFLALYVLMIYAGERIMKVEV